MCDVTEYRHTNIKPTLVQRRLFAVIFNHIDPYLGHPTQMVANQIPSSRE